jgi:hypothetical protein
MPSWQAGEHDFQTQAALLFILQRRIDERVMFALMMPAAMVHAMEPRVAEPATTSPRSPSFGHRGVEIVDSQRVRIHLGEYVKGGYPDIDELYKKQSVEQDRQRREALLLHVRHDRAAAEEDTTQFDGHQPIPFLDGDLLKLHAGHGGALRERSIVNEAIDAPEALHRGPRHALGRFRLRHVGLHCQGLVPSSAQRLHRCFGAGTVDVGHHNSCILVGQAFTVGSPDAVGAPGDDDHPILKSRHDFRFLQPFALTFLSTTGS